MKQRALWGAVIFLSLIGIAIVVRRTIAIAIPATTRPGLDDNFAAHPILTLCHILPGLLFIVLGPFQFLKGLRARRPALHRWMGRIFLAASLIVGITAVVMSPLMAIGGPLESAATMTFGVLFLFSLTKAYVHIRNRNIVRHREWMIRAYAIGLAVATIRPIVGLLFATSRLTRWTPQDFFGPAFWLGFTVQFGVAELWIRRANKRRRSM